MNARMPFWCATAQVDVLHGEMPKVARQNVLNDFRRGRLRALVVSDVVARGLDVADCDAGKYKQHASFHQRRF
jgi:superfamily II DNA/RNA helicase